MLLKNNYYILHQKCIENQNKIIYDDKIEFVCVGRQCTQPACPSHAHEKDTFEPILHVNNLSDNRE